MDRTRAFRLLAQQGTIREVALLRRHRFPGDGATAQEPLLHLSMVLGGGVPFPHKTRLQDQIVALLLDERGEAQVSAGEEGGVPGELL